MRPEPGQAALDARLATSTVEERVHWLAEMRRAGLLSVWQQVEGAGLSDPVEVAEFVLRRLYPEEREAWFADVLRQLRAAYAAGTWSGFRRPDGSDGRPPR